MRIASLLSAAGSLGALSLCLHCSTNNASCSIDSSHYDRSCKQDSDCIAVFSGSFCGGSTCACENAAISASAQQQYDSDFGATNAPRCPCPAAPPVGCNAGTCVVKAGNTVSTEAGAD